MNLIVWLLLVKHNFYMVVIIEELQNRSVLVFLVFGVNMMLFIGSSLKSSSLYLY